MPMLVLDKSLQQYIREKYDRVTESWEGLEVTAPLPNDDHQDLVGLFMLPLVESIQLVGLGRVRPGVNVTDRHADWTANFRGPDVVVYLATNPAINYGSHWQGGPDFLIEIISEGEDPHAKFDFYAKVNTREVLIVERDPWAVELFQLSGGKLVSAGRSDLSNGLVLSSGVLTLTFKLVAGTPRPRIEVTNTSTGRQWSC